MADIPADAPRSDDGYYWWDGSQWQLIDHAEGGQQGADDQQPAVVLTDEHFANMLLAAENDVVEA